MTRNEPVKYVVAGNREEYVNYVNKNLKTGVFYTYVYHPNQLKGLSEISGVFIGTFEQREDIEEIRLQIKLIQSRNSSSYKFDTWASPKWSKDDDKELLKLLILTSMA